MGHVRWRLFGTFAVLGRASGYASFMTSSARCPSGSNEITLSVGEYIMGDNYPVAESSTDRTITIYNAGTAVKDGSFTASDTLTVELSSTSGQYVFEISGGT